MTSPRVTHLRPVDSNDPDWATVRELDSRDSDGIRVDLLWSAGNRRPWVALTDRRTGESFSIPVRDGERALDVFHHPYAYAASHGVNLAAISAGLDSDIAQAA